MGTLETAGGPSQSPQLPLPPHIPEQSWREPPPPFLRSTFNQSCSFSENTGYGTLTHGITYSPRVDIGNELNVTTMDTTTPNSISSTPSLFLHSHPSTNLAGKTRGYHPPFITTNTNARPVDNRAQSNFTGTRTTHYTQSPTPTKITEKEFTTSLYINPHGRTSTTTQQRPTSDSRNQQEAQSPHVRPRHPLFVRVIRNSPTTKKPFHLPLQSATPHTTHSMPATVPNANQGSAAQPHRPRLIVCVRRNVSPDQPKQPPSHSSPCADNSVMHIRASRTNSRTTSSNRLCSTVGQSSDRRRIVLVCRKGASTYPILNLTDRCPYNGARQKTAVLPEPASSITAPSGLHQVAPTILKTELHSSSSTVNDKHSTTSSDTPGSAHNPIAENPANTSPTIEHSTKARNRLMSELLPPTEISSRASTSRSFLHRYSVPVIVPESIWHYHVRSYNHHRQNPPYETVALCNQEPTRSTRFNSPTKQRVIRQNSTFHAAPAYEDYYHMAQYYHHRSLHADDYTAILTGIPWYKPVPQPSHPENSYIRPGRSCRSTNPIPRPSTCTKQYWNHSSHKQAQAHYCFNHKRLRTPPQYSITSLTEDKNLLRPP